MRISAETMGGPGPRATPTWHEGRLYALGATGPLWCLDAATGEVLWHRNILDDGDGGEPRVGDVGIAADRR